MRGARETLTREAILEYRAKMSVQVMEGTQQDMQDRRNNNPKGSEESIHLRNHEEDKISHSPTNQLKR